MTTAQQAGQQQVKPGLAYRLTRDGQTWTVEYDSILTTEWVALEKATGLGWMDLTLLADRRAVRGILAFYWLARRRYEDPRLLYTDKSMEFPLQELRFEIVLTGDAPEGDEGEERRPDPSGPGRDQSPST